MRCTGTTQPGTRYTLWSHKKKKNDGTYTNQGSEYAIDVLTNGHVLSSPTGFVALEPEKRVGKKIQEH